jgi:hypothetical protein
VWQRSYSGKMLEDSVRFENGHLKWRYEETMVDQFKEWRGYTPLLLAIIVVAGGIVSYLAIDKINNMSDRTDKTLQVIGEINNGFTVYKIESENRFTKLETEVIDIQDRMSRQK